MSERHRERRTNSLTKRKTALKRDRETERAQTDSPRIGSKNLEANVVF